MGLNKQKEASTKAHAPMFENIEYSIGSTKMLCRRMQLVGRLVFGDFRNKFGRRELISELRI
jgi:hypothetical protein